MKVCQIIGLQRSGTNYLQDLITDNFNNVSVLGRNNEDYIWKHSPTPNFVKYPDCLLYIYKHPFNWIESALRAKVPDFLDKLESFNEGPIINNIPIKSLINLYNKSLQSWIIDYNLPIPIIHIQYETILDEKGIEHLFQKLKDRLNFKQDTNRIYVHKLGDTWCSNDIYQSNHLDNYKQVICKVLTIEQQNYIINNINKDILTLLYKYDT